MVIKKPNVTQVLLSTSLGWLDIDPGSLEYDTDKKWMGVPDTATFQCYASDKNETVRVLIEGPTSSILATFTPDTP